MTNEHWLQLAIAMITPILTLTIVMVGFLYNNARISDLRADLTTRMGDLHNDMDRLMAGIEAKIDILTGKIIELDNRMTRVEARLGVRGNPGVGCAARPPRKLRQKILYCDLGRFGNPPTGPMDERMQIKSLLRNTHDQTESND